MGPLFRGLAPRKDAPADTLLSPLRNVLPFTQIFPPKLSVRANKYPSAFVKVVEKVGCFIDKALRLIDLTFSLHESISGHHFLVSRWTTLALPHLGIIWAPRQIHPPWPSSTASAVRRQCERSPKLDMTHHHSPLDSPLGPFSATH